MQQIQFIQVTPEQLQKSILEGVRNQIQELKKNFQPKEPTQFLTRSQVAEMLQIDLSTVHNWTKKSILTAHQIGGRVYYKRSEVEDAMVELKKG
ncbi:helix-turn-helix domain-containing protein [Maribacter flavus]|uniref:Helix-turn-helix domain-containing protein n=1 Tax=Maribacter flavus TaxID=1658664 RepID=A0A5B2TVL4_9FLAO|nr:helix-turn-helix domain-containing protein [Maribacter flavus]KAA2218547.1 helix-turn-helix domain-containing protein [Maribacter flavus]